MPGEHVDILVVGAGLSGIGAGYHIQTKCPDKTYAILEGRETMGGTWDLFRYPGVRSDSDMFTLGYSFRPWDSQKAITDGESILNYIKETAAAFGIDQHIRYQHRVCGASWSSTDGLWTVALEVGADKTRQQMTCHFLYMCTGYYDYERGHQPRWAGMDDFNGEIVHPQKWTQAIDHAGKRVIVIGSGATAVTLVPAMAEAAAHVTMLQRSPTYIVSLPSESTTAKRLYNIFPTQVAHALSRWHSILFQMYQYTLARRFPQAVKKGIMDMARAELGDDYDVETHLNPSYNPWDERLCVVPDSDLFKAINAGKADIVTGAIERFTETGIRLESGAELVADMIVTATGLRLKILNGVSVTVDGEKIALGDTFTYKGLMYSNVPNLAHSFGYVNASWTLKSELISEYVCRLVNHMDQHGFSRVVAHHDGKAGEGGEPVVDFTSGYIRRAQAELPKKGAARPWLAHQNYIKDMLDIRYGSLNDGVLTFSRLPQPSAEAAPV